MFITEKDRGRIVRHKLTGERIIIVHIKPWNFINDDKRIKIRRLDYSEIEVYEEELENDLYPPALKGG
jgi:hypothetical protein